MKRTLTTASLLLVLLMLAACAQANTVEDTAPATTPVSSEQEAPTAEPATTVPTTPKGGSVTRALTTEPSGLDPHGPPGSGQNIVLPYLFDTLIYRDAENNYHPFLAESWEVTDDGQTITFQLKEDITFHDGTPMDAQAVKFSFDRFMELGAKNPVAAGLKTIGEVEVVDDSTVRFLFDAPSAVFFGTISMPYAGIVSPTAVEKWGEEFSQHPVGTGPFMMETWEPGISIALSGNPAYNWGPLDVKNQAAPNIDQALFKVIPDASTQLAAFETGETDIIFVNQPSHLAKLEQMEDVELTEVAINSLIYLGFNAGQSPLDDATMRQALSHGVNKQEILDTALGGIGKLACSPLASTLPGYDPSLCDGELSFDPAQAENLLTEAGYSKNSDGVWERDGEALSLSLLTSTRAPNGDIATVLQSQLAAIGVPVDIQQLDARAAMKSAAAGEYDLFLWRYGWNDADVLNIYLGSDRIGSTNRTFYSNPDVDALLNQALTELDADARAKIYQDAVRHIMADAAWQPLYEPVDVIVVGPQAQDVVIGPMGRVFLNDATVAQ